MRFAPCASNMLQVIICVVFWFDRAMRRMRNAMQTAAAHTNGSIARSSICVCVVCVCVCVEDLCVACEILRNCFEMNMKYTTRGQLNKLINDIDKFPSQL